MATVVVVVVVVGAAVVVVVVSVSGSVVVAVAASGPLVKMSPLMIAATAMTRRTPAAIGHFGLSMLPVSIEVSGIADGLCFDPVESRVAGSRSTS